MPSCASAGVIARLRPIIDPALAFVLLAVLWEYGAALFHLKAYLLPPLSKVLALPCIQSALPRATTLTLYVPPLCV